MRFFESIAKSTWNQPKKWALVVTVFTVLCVLGLPFLKFEFDLMRFKSAGSEVSNQYYRFEQAFSKTPQSVILIPVTEHNAFHPKTLQLLQTFTDSISAIPGVEEVTSIDNIRLPVYIGFAFSAEKVAHNGVISKDDSLLLRNLPITPLSLYSVDAKYPVINFGFSPNTSLERINQILKEVDEYASTLFGEHHLMGRYWAEYQYSEMLRVATITTLLGAVLITIIMLWILFRRLGSILLPALAIITGMVCFFGIKGWSGSPMDILGTLFPAILLIVGMSDVVHLYAKIQWKLNLGLNLQHSIREAWTETGTATFLTSLTTAIGFLSLLTTDVIPIRHFGLEAAGGVLLMFVSCIIIMPVFLRWAKSKTLLPKPASNTEWIHNAERMMAIAKNKWIVPFVFTALALGAIYSAMDLETGVRNYWQIEPSSRLGQDIQFYEAEDGGLRNLDIGLERLDTSLGRMDSPEAMRVIAELTSRMRANPVFGAIVSSSDLPSMLNMMRNGGQKNGFAIPSSDERVNGDLDWWFENAPESFDALIGDQGNLARIFARLSNIKSDSANVVENWLYTELADISPDYKLVITGNSAIMDAMNESLVTNMLWSLFWAFIVIAMIMGFLFKSLRMTIISLIPNTFPLVVALGIIGLFDIPMGTSIAMVLTIAFVIAVDDTIHFLMKFRSQLPLYDTVEEAILHSSAQVGRAMILSSIVMLAAFIPLFFSGFLEQNYFAMVLSIVIISALLADLLVLPWLLLRFYPKKKASDKND